MNAQTLVCIVRGLTAGLTASAFVATCPGDTLGDRFKLPDLPPSPFDANLLTNTLPKPDSVLQRIERDVSLVAVTTNQAEIALIADVKELKTKLSDLEATVNGNDPLLRIYGQYVETAHDWVMKNHNREYGAASQYFGPVASSPSTQRAHDNVISLIDMVLYRELANNTNFGPMLKAAFDAFERKMPGFFSGSYARNDTLIGFQPAAPSKPVATFDAYLAELDKRHELVTAKLDQLQREVGIPIETITGWMYGDLYRMLDGSAQQYVMLSTPAELETLRRQLEQKLRELSRLQASAR